MPKFYINFDGSGEPEREVEAASIEAARDEAIMSLGRHLQANPAFAYERHWRVDLQDSSKRHLMYVIVACVEAAPRINLASYES